MESLGLIVPDFFFAGGKAAGGGGFEAIHTAVGQDVNSTPEACVDFDRVFFAREDRVVRGFQIRQVASVNQFKVGRSNITKMWQSERVGGEPGRRGREVGRKLAAIVLGNDPQGEAQLLSEIQAFAEGRRLLRREMV